MIALSVHGSGAFPPSHLTPPLHLTDSSMISGRRPPCIDADRHRGRIGDVCSCTGGVPGPLWCKGDERMSPNIWYWDQAADQEAGDNVSHGEPGHQHHFNIDSLPRAAAPPCPHVTVRVISSASRAHAEPPVIPSVIFLPARPAHKQQPCVALPCFTNGGE